MSDHEGAGQAAALAANEEGEAVLVAQEPAGGAPAVLDLTREGNRVRLLVVAAVGQETGLIDFALTLANGTAMQQRFGLVIVQAIERNLGQTPRGNPNWVPIQNITAGPFDEPFYEWLEQLLADNIRVAGFLNWDEDEEDDSEGDYDEDEDEDYDEDEDEDYDEDEDEDYDEDEDEDEGVDAGWEEEEDEESDLDDEVPEGPEVPIGGGPNPALETPARASRRPAKEEEPKEQPGFGGNYRDRSRSPIDDEGARD